MCEEVRGLELVVILLSSTKEGAGGGKRAQRPTHPYECATPTISDLTKAVEASRMYVSWWGCDLRMRMLRIQVTRQWSTRALSLPLSLSLSLLFSDNAIKT